MIIDLDDIYFSIFLLLLLLYGLASLRVLPVAVANLLSKRTTLLFSEYFLVVLHLLAFGLQFLELLKYYVILHLFRIICYCNIILIESGQIYSSNLHFQVIFYFIICLLFLNHFVANCLLIF